MSFGRLERDFCYTSPVSSFGIKRLVWGIVVTLPFLSTSAGEGPGGFGAELQVFLCPSPARVAVGFHGNVALCRIPVSVGRWKEMGRGCKTMTLIERRAESFCFLPSFSIQDNISLFEKDFA